jgi:hypothetical protein
MARNVSFAKHAAEAWCQAVVVRRKCHLFLVGIHKFDLRTDWFGSGEKVTRIFFFLVSHLLTDCQNRNKSLAERWWGRANFLTSPACPAHLPRSNSGSIIEGAESRNETP